MQLRLSELQESLWDRPKLLSPNPTVVSRLGRGKARATQGKTRQRKANQCNAMARQKQSKAKPREKQGESLKGGKVNCVKIRDMIQKKGRCKTFNRPKRIRHVKTTKNWEIQLPDRTKHSNQDVSELRKGSRTLGGLPEGFQRIWIKIDIDWQWLT